MTKEDLRTIVKEENAALEKRVKEYIDLKIDALDQKVDALDKSLNGKVDDLDKSLNGRIDDIRAIMITLIALVTAAIAIPQVIIAYRARDQKGMQAQIDQLRAQIEAMQNTSS